MMDVQIGSIETVIEASNGTGNRADMMAAVLQVVRAEMARLQAEEDRRKTENAVKPRSFGQRY